MSLAQRLSQRLCVDCGVPPWADCVCDGLAGLGAPRNPYQLREQRASEPILPAGVNGVTGDVPAPKASDPRNYHGGVVLTPPPTDLACAVPGVVAADAPRGLVVIGSDNMVRGCPGWFYELRVTSRRPPPLDPLPIATFGVYNPDTGERIDGLRSSAYRTTTLARKMGERELRGYEHVAREAIRARRKRSS